jgi:hypothetical protein
MLGYTKEDLDRMLHMLFMIGFRGFFILIPPPTFPKEDLKRTQGLAKDGLLVAQGLP